MMSVIFAVCMMLAQRVQSKIYYNTLIKSMFRYQDKDGIKQENGKKKKKNKYKVDDEAIDL